MLSLSQRLDSEVIEDREERVTCIELPVKIQQMKTLQLHDTQITAQSEKKIFTRILDSCRL